MNSILRLVLLSATVTALATMGCQHSPPTGSDPAVVEPDEPDTDRAERTNPTEESESTDETDENETDENETDENETDENETDENETDENSERAPQPAPRLLLEDVVVQSIVEIEPPEVERTNGCVEHHVARQHASDATRYHAYLAEVAAAEKGWRRLANVVTLGPNSPLRRGSGFGNVDFTRDRIIDDQGHHWMKVGSWTCGVPGPPTTDYFIDGDLQVFRLRPDTSSCPTRKLAGCGTFPRYGCGRKSPPSFHFVRVPKDAVRVDDRTIGIAPAKCVVIEPVDGYGPPPP